MDKGKLVPINEMRYNVVVSYVFSCEKDADDWIKICKDNNHTILRKGVYDRPILQKVITQEVFE